MAILPQLLLQAGPRTRSSCCEGENLAISAVVGLCGGCQSHVSGEAVPTSEVLQLIKGYTQGQLHFG